MVKPVCFLCRWLEDKKVLPSEIDNILEKDDVETRESEVRHTLPHHDQSLWLVDCNRHEAESYLAGTPDGTFLIRPKPEEGDVYVLSIS